MASIIKLTHWGSTVQIKSTAHDFRASGITFESSFNRYITDEEIEDGVTLDTSMERNNTTTVRQYGVDVMAKSATERAAAIAVESNQTEFYNCSFLSSQDTLYTNEGNKIYFKNHQVRQEDISLHRNQILIVNCICSEIVRLYQAIW